VRTVKLVYMDTSAIAKRYVRERGSDRVDTLYRAAEQGKFTLTYSVWNIGEVLGVLDKQRTRGSLTQQQYDTAISIYFGENEKLIRLNSLVIVPITNTILVESWKLIQEQHIYAADALQIASAAQTGSILFLTADKRLAEAASNHGLKAMNVEEENNIEEKIEELGK
jgi:predicted nucleic acid-binding protein